MLLFFMVRLAAVSFRSWCRIFWVFIYACSSFCCTVFSSWVSLLHYVPITMELAVAFLCCCHTVLYMPTVLLYMLRAILLLFSFLPYICIYLHYITLCCSVLHELPFLPHHCSFYLVLVAFVRFLCRISFSSHVPAASATCLRSAFNTFLRCSFIRFLVLLLLRYLLRQISEIAMAAWRMPANCDLRVPSVSLGSSCWFIFEHGHLDQTVLPLLRTYGSASYQRVRRWRCWRVVRRIFGFLARTWHNASAVAAAVCAAGCHARLSA